MGGRRSPAGAAAPAHRARVARRAVAGERQVNRARVARRAVAGLLAAAVALAACGAGATPVPSGPAALPAGTHTSRVFSPQVTFTVPDGWWNPSDSRSFFSILPVESNIVGIYLFRDPLPASQDPTCPQTAEPGVATTSLALLAWIRDLPGLVVGSPRLVTVGGLRGTEIDVAIEAGWTASCPFANGVPTVPLFVGADGQLRWVIAGSERLRLSLLDVPGGGTVVVDIDAFDGSLWDQLLAAATPIVNSFVFATP